MIQIIKKITLGLFTVVVLTGVADAAIPIASKEYVDAQNITQTADINQGIVTGDLGLKADKATTAIDGEFSVVTASGEFSGSGLFPSDVLYASELAGFATDADISGKENTSNKSDNIFVDSGDTVKYTTAHAVNKFAIPQPPAHCVGVQAQCVLLYDKAANDIYWEDVTMP